MKFGWASLPYIIFEETLPYVIIAQVKKMFRLEILGVIISGHTRGVYGLVNPSFLSDT